MALVNKITDGSDVLLGVTTGESLVSTVEQDEVLLLLYGAPVSRSLVGIK